MVEARRRAPAVAVGIALAALLAAAAALRWPASPSTPLWHDEAWRGALLWSSGGVGDLTGLSDRMGRSMLLSEWVQGRIGVALLGADELAFRIWPLLAGVLGVAAAYAFLARIGGRAGALLGAALLAFGPGFVTHAREFKPYALDVLLVLVSLHAAVALGAGEAGRRRGDALLSGVLSVFALGSLTFVFVYPAIVAYRFFHLGRRGVRDLAVLALPSLVFAVYALLLILPMSGSTRSTQAMWHRFYPTSADNLRFLMTEVPESTDLYVLGGWMLAFAAAFLALPVLARRRGDGLAWLLLGPFAFHGAASLLGLYPLFGRPSTYLYALLALALAHVAGAGLEWIARRPRATTRFALGLAVGAAGLALVTTRPVRDPYPLPDRPVRALPEALRTAAAWPPDMSGRALAALTQEHREGQPVLYSDHALYALVYYRHTLPPESSLKRALGGPALTRRSAVNDDTSELLCHSVRDRAPEPAPGAQRLWMVTSMRWNPELLEEVLGRIGRLHFAVRERNQGLVRVDLERSTATLPCLEHDFADVELASGGEWTARRFAVRRFPSFFQLRMDAALEGPGAQVDVVLRGDGSAALRSKRFVLGPGARRRLAVGHRGWQGQGAFGDARALEVRARATGGAPIRLRIADLHVR